MSDELPGRNAPRRKGRFHSRYSGEDYQQRFSLPKRRTEDQPGSPTPESVADESPEEPGTGHPAETLRSEQGAQLEEQSDGGTPAAVEDVPPGEDSDLLPNFRLTKVYEAPPTRPSPLKDWRWLSVTALLLAGGLGGGYLLGRSTAPVPPPPLVTDKAHAKSVIDALDKATLAAVDTAFAATKQGNYKDAREQFLALREQHPQWWSMGIEAARASLYLRDPQEAQRALKTVTSEEGLPDSDFLMALLHLTNKELDLAENSFASAVARDPARPDFFYFWGECLRRDGKPREAADKFRSALLRNQYENFEGLYQTKLWLSLIQADLEESSGANKAIDEALASKRPSYEALFAAAARELKGKRYPAAADFLARAQAITEPAVFRVIMQDPTFLEEASHVEIAPFYR